MKNKIESIKNIRGDEGVMGIGHVYPSHFCDKNKIYNIKAIIGWKEYGYPYCEDYKEICGTKKEITEYFIEDLEFIINKYNKQNLDLHTKNKILELDLMRKFVGIVDSLLPEKD